MTLELAIKTVLHNFGFAMFLLAVAIAAVRSWRGKLFAAELWQWLLLLPVGVTGVYTAVGHIFFSEECAEVIGWETSPFQYEVGIADLTIGVLGLLAFWSGFSFRLAASIAAMVWFGGDAIGHVQQMIEKNNYEPGNAGSWFWMDVLVPISLLVCVVICWRQEQRAQVERPV